MQRGHCKPRRRQFPLLVWVVLCVGVVGPWIGGSRLADWAGSRSSPGALVCRVIRADFVHDVRVQGELESAVNVEVRCEARSLESSWFRILEVVPEGTHVEPGDMLVRLDSSGLEAERDRQKVLVEQARAAVIQAHSRYQAALLAEKTYLDGEFKLQEEQAKQALMIAEDRERRARELFDASRALAADGYLTDLQLKADEYAWKAAQTDLGIARIKLSVLQRLTKPTRLTQLRAAVVTAKARVVAAEMHCKLSLDRLAYIEEQIEKCVIRAHVPGQVVLAHLHHYGHSHMVEPGEVTHERRVLVRLPDLRHMQVTAKVEEDKIAWIRPGQSATVRLQAFPEVALRGRVVRINQYPEPEDWMSSSVQRYKTTIAIETPPEGARPGMTADVTLHVQHLADRLQVPCTAVLRHGDRSYCIAYDGDNWEAKEVDVGPNNGTCYLVRGGLEEGEQLVLSAAAHRDKVELPPLRPSALAVRSRSAGLQAIQREGLNN